MLISKYALDWQPYHTSWNDVTWETCTLRTWLNGTFCDNTFTEEEQTRIVDTNVSADQNPEYSTDPGNATTDRVFLLSIKEAEKYFTLDEVRNCAPTKYAEAQGARRSSTETAANGEAACWWWLRSPGRNQNTAAFVNIDGSILCTGHIISNIDDVKGAVRPALWVNWD